MPRDLLIAIGGGLMSAVAAVAFLVAQYLVYCLSTLLQFHFYW